MHGVGGGKELLLLTRFPTQRLAYFLYFLCLVILLPFSLLTRFSYGHVYPLLFLTTLLFIQISNPSIHRLIFWKNDLGGTGSFEL